MNLSVKIGKAQFPNPVTVASGTFGHAEKYYNLGEVKKLGAIIPKTVTLHPQEGNPPPRIVETPSGMLNAIGIENPGVDNFIKNKLPVFQRIGVPLIISILGHTDQEFKILAEKFNVCISSESKGQSGASRRGSVGSICALELNLSCPNLGKKILVAQDPEATYRVVRLVKEVSKAPVLAKLSPDVTDITQIAKAAEDAGADGISLVNTFTAMVIDIAKRKSVLGNFTGGLSGPAIRPIALRMVYQVAQTVKVPIVAMGGIMTAEDALQYIIAGATMVAVGTANFINPRAPLEVLNGIINYMKENKIDNLVQVIGSVKKPNGSK